MFGAKGLEMVSSSRHVRIQIRIANTERATAETDGSVSYCRRCELACAVKRITAMVLRKHNIAYG